METNAQNSNSQRSGNTGVSLKKPLVVSEGLQFSELLQIVKLRRKILYALMAMSLFGILIRQVLYVPLFYATTTLSIQKIESSPMQMALANLGPMPVDTSDRLKKYVDYIQSNEFFLAVAETLKFKEGYQLLNLSAPSEGSLTSKRFWTQFLANNFGRQGLPRANVPEPVLVPVEELAGLLHSVMIAESNVPTSDTIRIKVTTIDAFTAMVLANTITEVFIKKTGERDYNEVTEVKRFIEAQLDSTTERLKRSESVLVDFKRHHNIISIAAEHTSFSNKLSAIENELEATKIKLQENQKLIALYETSLAKKEQRILTQGAEGVNNSDSQVIARLRRELDSFQQRKVLMQAQGYSEDSWQMTQVNRELDQAAEALKEKLGGGAISQSAEDDGPAQSLEGIRAKHLALTTENKGFDVKISTLEKSRSNLLKNLETLPKDEQVLITLTKDLDLQFELYSLLKKKLQEVEIQQVALQSRVSINERSMMGIPVPRTSLMIKMLFALLVSSFLGSTIAFLLEAMDPTVKHLSDLERMEVFTLGSIPRIQASQIRQTLGSRSYRPDLLICKEKPESGESMAFKYIRAQITRMRASDGTPAKVIALTSPERGDGKSLTCSNIAMSLSQLEKKTLLIDADFRNPSIPWYFGYKNGNGLTSVLTLKCSLDEVILKDRMPNLDILPAGWALPNPTELLSNDKFRLLLEHLRTIYDYIIIDAPPSVALVDAAVVAGIADSVILVAGFRKTKKHMVFIALKKILQVSNKHVYGILNGVGEIHEYQNYAAQGSTFFEKSIAEENLDSKGELVRFQEILRSKKAS